MKKINGWTGIIAIVGSLLTWLLSPEIVHLLPDWAPQAITLLLTVIAAWSKKPSVVHKTEEEPPRRF